MQNIKALKTKKGRDEAGLFMIEGERFISEIPHHIRITKYLAAKRYATSHDMAKYHAPVEVIKDGLFDSLADTKNPQGIMAICEKFYWSLADLPEDGFILMGENLNDPGNIGTLIRTAAAAGAAAVVLTEGSGDVFNPKVLRATTGAAFRLPVIQDVSLAEAAAAVKQAGFAMYAAHLHGETTPYKVDMAGKCCILIGNESHGLSEAATAAATKLIRLPMASDVESLNASMAGGILLYEAVRQRL
ncbi:MAG: RNA methyltransferase [Defluviitaleaceae bacterium]|nr:RNA methyltransferase [Defluviitaleaceae bacterium]